MGNKVISGRKPKEFTTRAKYLAEQYKLLERMAKIGGGKIAAEHTSDEIAAAKLVLGYAYGQPTSKHEHGGPDGKPIPVEQVEYKLVVVEHSGGE